MRITLGEARLILKNKEEELKDLYKKRMEVQTDIYKKTATVKELAHDKHEVTVDQVAEKIDKVEQDIRKLRVILTKANIENVVEYTVDKEKITLQEAIYLVKQYRDSHPHIKRMGEVKTTTKIVDPTPRYGVQNGIDRSYEEITEPTFDTKKYREKAKKIESQITKLELCINQVNYTAMVDVPEDMELNRE